MSFPQPILRPFILGLTAVLLTLSFRGSAVDPSSLEVLRERLNTFVEPTVDGKTLFELQMNALELDHQGLSNGSAEDSIWSGDYWPLRYGAISAEYKDKGGYRTGLFGKLGWKKMKKRWDKRWADLDPRNLSRAALEDLAPAEKLDLLMSDYDLTLSKNVWKSISNRYSRGGRIKMWEGFCHGWATAAIQAPRPTQVVTVKSRDGRYEIPFTPHDLKGLAAYLWGQSLVQDYTRVAGKRCSNKRRNFDPLTGMSDDPSCNGVEPALFHLALTHLMGMRKESFVINLDNDVQVWNQPLHSYSMKYFNVVTGRTVSIEDAIVSVDSIRSDVRKKHRAPETRYVLGVSLKLKYVKETQPNRRSSNSVASDSIKRIEYIYDLELDENRNIIGGQWRNFRTDSEAVTAMREDQTDYFPGYPGFIWKIQRSETTALSIASDAPAWDVNQPIPETFVERHRAAAGFKYKIWKTDKKGNVLTDANGNYTLARESLQPQPLSLLVHGLLRAARDPSDRRTLEQPR